MHKNQKLPHSFALGSTFNTYLLSYHCFMDRLLEQASRLSASGLAAVATSPASSPSPTSVPESNISSSTGSSTVMMTKSHLAIVAATQNNIGVRYHRQNDIRRAMEWYLESVRTRVALLELPVTSEPLVQTCPSDDTRTHNNNNGSIEQEDDSDGSCKDETASSSAQQSRHKRRRNVIAAEDNDQEVSPSADIADNVHVEGSTTGSNIGTTLLLAKYMHEAATVEAIEASATTATTTAVPSVPSSRRNFISSSSSSDADSADASIGDDHDDDDDHDDNDDDDDDDDLSFVSSPLDEDEEEHLSTFLFDNNNLNVLPVDATGMYIGLNSFSEPVTIDVCIGLVAGTDAADTTSIDSECINNNKNAPLPLPNNIIHASSDVHSAATLFNMSLLHQQEGSSLDASRTCLEIGLQVLTPTAATCDHPFPTGLAIMLHTNLGYVSHVAEDNDHAMKHFTKAFSIISRAVQRTYADIKTAEGAQRQDAANADAKHLHVPILRQYLHAKRVCHHYYCRAEVAALLNVARCCEADGQYEIALRACLSAIQRLQSLPPLPADPSSSSDGDEQQSSPAMHVERCFEDALDLHSATFVLASIHYHLANDAEAMLYYAAYFRIVQMRHGQEHPHAIAALLGMSLIQLFTSDRMCLAAGAA